MHEDQTYETIMSRLLSNVSSDLDKAEGSFIWDALAPVAIELAQSYIALDIATKQSFVETATDDYLDRGTSEMGVTRIAASKSIGVVELTGSVGAIIPAGTLLSTATAIQFRTDSDVTIGVEGITTVAITAIVAGVGGNVPANIITTIPISVSGLTAVTNTEPTYGGDDEESDEELRKRYFQEISDQPIDGNIAQYKRWVEAYPGIGRSKVIPLWNGANTVKVSILSSSNGVASAALVDDFQDYMDPGQAGLGNGVAPIGSKVTVTTATPVTLNISTSLELAGGYAEITGIEDAIAAHLASLSYSKTTVSYIGIGAAILSLPAVERIENLRVNGATADITLTEEQIPVLGTADWTVITS